LNRRKKINAVIDYHNQTKHYPDRFASSLGFLDWQNQPNPFRSYHNTKKIELPFRKEVNDVPYLNIYETDSNQSREFNKQSFGEFLEYSLGLSAWKSIPGGGTWPLRINPSSGNLHPTEAYLITNEIQGLESGLFHYSPYLHSLEKRAELTSSINEKLFNFFQGEAFLIGLSSIYWRESWKYGERAYRYCNHDLGHALACIRMSANLLGWKVKCLNEFSHEDIDTLLGLRSMQQDSAEIEEGDIFCIVYRSIDCSSFDDFPFNVIHEFGEIDFIGSPNQLSKEHVNWEIINSVALNCKKERTTKINYHFPDFSSMVQEPKKTFRMERMGWLFRHGQITL
jgi:SagB-type dehydrogenase family enzyme